MVVRILCNWRYFMNFLMTSKELLAPWPIFDFPGQDAQGKSATGAFRCASHHEACLHHRHRHRPQEMEEIERVAITSMIEFLVRPLSGVLT